MPSADLVVQFQDVSYQVGNRYLVSHLNLSIGQGEALILLGRSGSGKTTTLRLINRLLTPSSGDVRVKGRSTRDWDVIQLRRSMGYVIQEIGLFPHLSIAENVGLVPSLENWTARRIKARVYELLYLVGLEPGEFARRYPDELSGTTPESRRGEGFSRRPPILLMDEPFGALDPITRLDLQQQLKQLQLQLGKTIVFVTHDLQEALFLGSRIGLMVAGELVSIGTPAEFLEATHAEAQRYLACLRNYA